MSKTSYEAMVYACKRKTPFKKRKQAQAEADRLTAKNPAAPAKPYQCLICGLWHVAHDREEDDK